MPKILFADGLGQYASATDMARRFLAVNATTDVASYTRTNGRTAKEVSGWFGSAVAVAVNPSTNTQGSLMCRVRLAGLSGTFSSIVTIGEADGTTHLTVYANADGSLTIRRGSPSSGTALVSTAAGVVTTGVRYALELKWTIHDTTGLAALRINELDVATFSGDTRNGGTSGTWSRVDFSLDQSSGRTVYVGDLHIADATTTHDFLGDLQTDYHYPSGAGNSAGGTPSAGANWQCVDDNPSNGDTDYVAMTAAATKDTYAYQDLASAGATIRAVTVVIDAKKIDSGTAKFKTVTRRGGTDYSSAAEVSPSGGGYRYLDAGPMETDPSTSAAWTETNFNAAEFGFEKTA